MDLRKIVTALAMEASRLQGPSLVLLGLSVADIVVTFVLLRTGQGYYESNPVARWFFAHWNMRGMAVFKLAAIGSAITLGEIIERHRPGWGRLVLWTGCVVSAAVVWHGLRLCMGLPGLPIGARE
jgi:hypothetical protein